jgi:aminoglycoside/choline kinase family phosphotransferase
MKSLGLNNGRGEAARDFLARAGWKDASVAALPGDASTRRYYRVKQNGHGAMLMDQPQSAEAPACPPDATPEERQALGYNATARLAGADCERFIATAEFLRSRGLAAPQIYADDTSQGFVLLEDFGDDLYADVLGKGVDEELLYRAAVDAIARLHAEPAPRHLSHDATLYDYDLTACLAETDLMTEWFMPLALGRSASADEMAEHRGLWREALEAVRSPEPVFVHRDYHAQNLFWLPERSGAARVGMIDFQDALAGNKCYDVISLLEDARRDVSPELANVMKEHYLAAMKNEGRELDGELWTAEAAVTAAQRNAKIAGIFARLASRDRKPRYLAHLPRVWNYLESDLAHPALARLNSWYDRAIPREMRRASQYEGAKS